MQQDRTSRRQAIQWLGACAIPLLARGVARADDLPLHTTGIEHFGLTVPDPEATAKFYGRIFDRPAISGKRSSAPVLRQTRHRLSGVRRKCHGRTPSIDHFCALIENYQPQEMRKSLEAAGVTMSPGPFGMALDPDGLRLQLLRVPGGLAKTIIPAYRLSQDDALFEAVAPDHVMLHVSDLDRSAEHYKKLFGPAAVAYQEAGARLVWRGQDQARLGARGQRRKTQHSPYLRARGGFRQEIGDRKAQAHRHREHGLGDEGLVRFRDPNGIVMELKGEA